MHGNTRHPSPAAPVRAGIALFSAAAIVLSFALLSGPALTTVGIVSVVATVLAVGHAIGTGKSAGRRTRTAYADPAVAGS